MAVAVGTVVFARFTGLFSHSVHLDVECRVAGDAGSLLPGVLPPNLLHVGTTLDIHGVFLII